MDACYFPPNHPRPPVTERQFALAELEIGFALPPLLRALYTRVADGDFGPGCGFFPLASGDWSVVELAKCAGACDNDAQQDLSWPPRLLQVVSWGCLYRSCVDCSRQSSPVIFYDNDYDTEGAAPADYLYPEADSLEVWLWAWLDGVDLWEVGPKKRKGVN